MMAPTPPSPHHEQAHSPADEVGFWDEWLHETRLALQILVCRAPVLLHPNAAPAHPLDLGALCRTLRSIEATAREAAGQLAPKERADALRHEDDELPADPVA
jgi:hypothetical protein